MSACFVWSKKLKGLEVKMTLAKQPANAQHQENKILMSNLTGDLISHQAHQSITAQFK